MNDYLDMDRVNRRMENRRRREQKLKKIYIGIGAAVVLLILAVVLLVVGGMFSKDASGKPDTTQGTPGSESGSDKTGTEESETKDTSDTDANVSVPRPEWEEQLLTPNKYSRPQRELDGVNGVVVHYVGNPNTTAKQNRDYFESLAITHETSASSHFVVGLKGEIIQCIPLNEVAYASRHRNADTISIEVCHPTEEGWFNDSTYDSVIALVAWLVVEYDLDVEDVIRHYDVTGKECPKYYVENESAWITFKEDVQSYIDTNSK